jgi:hypothetical protein
LNPSDTNEQTKAWHVKQLPKEMADFLGKDCGGLFLRQKTALRTSRKKLHIFGKLLRFASLVCRTKFGGSRDRRHRQEDRIFDNQPEGAAAGRPASHTLRLIVTCLKAHRYEAQELLSLRRET